MREKTHNPTKAAFCLFLVFMAYAGTEAQPSVDPAAVTLGLEYRLINSGHEYAALIVAQQEKRQ